MDPTQLPNAESSELEQRLLELARHDQIPTALGSRMAAGLGVQFTGAALHGGLAAGSRVGAPLFGKTGLWGVLSIALVSAVATWYVVPSAPHAARSTQRAASVSSPPPAPDQAVEAPIAAANIEVALPQATTARDVVEPPRTRPAPALDDDAALRAEVALLDRAREALHDDEGARALRLLDQHRRRFAHAALAPEAAALRIEALVQLGAYAQAESMSQRFVSAYPQHPLSERVAQLANQSKSSSVR